jgi:hypothetical protein
MLRCIPVERSSDLVITMFLRLKTGAAAARIKGRFSYSLLTLLRRKRLLADGQSLVSAIINPRGTVPPWEPLYFITVSATFPPIFLKPYPYSSETAGLFVNIKIR